jgi:hypothetical protein
MNMNDDDFMERYRPFISRGWTLRPSSYQIRNPDHTAGPWVAQVHVFHETAEETTVQSLLERDIRFYDDADHANNVALWMGLRWLEESISEFE